MARYVRPRGCGTNAVSRAPALSLPRITVTMHRSCPADRCCDGSCQRGGNSSPLICSCLNVTEETVVNAIATLGLRTVKEVRKYTGAGDGCTACHPRIREVLKQHAQSPSEPIFSVK